MNPTVGEYLVCEKDTLVPIVFCLQILKESSVADGESRWSGQQQQEGAGSYVSQNMTV